MTHHVRSFKSVAAASSTWRELSSPPAANDVTLERVPLSRGVPHGAAEIELLRATLDLSRPNDLRAAALLLLLQLGLRKRELVELDISDVVQLGAVMCVRVKSRRQRDHGKQTFLPVIGTDARVLRAYLAQQQDEAAPAWSPLFYNVEHGRADRLRRITANAVSYWLLGLRLRAREAPSRVSGRGAKARSTRGAGSARR